MTKFDLLTVNTFNCRGIRCERKRSVVFNWLKHSNSGIIFLQETHSVNTDEDQWKKEWSGEIFFSHGTSNSKGVAILIPSKLGLEVKISKSFHDQEGRILLLDCTIEENNFVFINIYAPTKDKKIEQDTFFENLNELILNYSDRNLMIGGDFNVCLNPDLDKKGGCCETRSSYCKNLNNLIEDISLVDIWRLRNNDKLQFTRRERAKSGIVQSCIDFWLISSAVEYLIKSCEIKPGYYSDHSVVNLKIDLIWTQPRGRGCWKFNNNLLNDPEYIALIKQSLNEILKNEHFDDKNLQWEYIKCQLRTETISFSQTKSKKQK